MSERLPRPPREVPVDRDRAKLAPKFNAAVQRVLERMRAQGFDPIVFEGFRSTERQRFLYGFGREYDDGRGIVTHSKTALKTWHGFGLAVDIISASKAWGAPPAFWDALREACADEGLRHGDDWDMDGVPVARDPNESFSDRPHVQWGRPMRRSPSPRAAQLWAEGGLSRVWKEVGAA